MSKWLVDLKDSDKVALAILLLGVSICGSSSVSYLAVIIWAHLQETDLDRAVTIIKDFFEVGTTLIGAAMLALKLSPKEPPAEIVKTETRVSSPPPLEPPKGSSGGY